MINLDDLKLEFVYDGKIVRMTGRYAEQKKRSGKMTLLVEICPASIANASPNNTNFNRWINRNLLIDIHGQHVLAKVIADETAAKQIINEGTPNAA